MPTLVLLTGRVVHNRAREGARRDLELRRPKIGHGALERGHFDPWQEVSHETRHIVRFDVPIRAQNHQAQNRNHDQGDNLFHGAVPLTTGAFEMSFKYWSWNLVRQIHGWLDMGRHLDARPMWLWKPTHGKRGRRLSRRLVRFRNGRGLRLPTLAGFSDREHSETAQRSPCHQRSRRHRTRRIPNAESVQDRDSRTETGGAAKMARMARAKKTRVTESAWRQRPLPVLDERRCTGCGWCDACCPTDALAMDGATPWLVRPARCVSCGLCADVCPTKAITMVPHRPLPSPTET